MLTDFFWEQMLDEVIEELKTSQPVSEYCTEYDANYVKENFEPRILEITADKNVSRVIGSNGFFGAPGKSSRYPSHSG